MEQVRGAKAIARKKGRHWQPMKALLVLAQVGMLGTKLGAGPLRPQQEPKRDAGAKPAAHAAAPTKPAKLAKQVAALRAENQRLRLALKEQSKAPLILNMKSRGRLHFRPDFGQLLVGDEYFDLRKRALARWCIRYMFRKKAFSARSALDFADDIDPAVRKLAKREARGIHSVAKIDNFFNDAKHILPKLRQLLIRYDPDSGKYFLDTRLVPQVTI